MTPTARVVGFLQVTHVAQLVMGASFTQGTAVRLRRSRTKGYFVRALTFVFWSFLEGNKLESKVWINARSFNLELSERDLTN